MIRLFALVPVALLAGCTADPAPPAAPPSEPAAESSVAAEPAAEPAADSLAVLTADGWGPLRIGMTREDVTAAAGPDADPAAVGGPEPDQCDEFHPSRTPDGMLVMLEDGRLTRISLTAVSDVETDRGVGVGDLASEVEAAYGDAADVSPHKYVPAPGAYITAWATPPPAPEARGVVYEIGADGRVSLVHAGGPSVQYVEGCA